MTQKSCKFLNCYLIFLLTVFIAGIYSGAADTTDLFPDKAYPEMATGYTVEYHDTYKVVQINDPWGRESENYTYLLVQRGEEVPDGYPDAEVFYVPVQNVVTMGVVHIPHISELGEIETITGHNGVKQVHDEGFQNRLSNGDIIEVGSGAVSMTSTLKMEDLIELEPELIFCVANGNKEYDNHYKLLEAGLKPVLTADWMENDPLARAEWIKFFSLFYNKEKEANEYFDEIKQNYNNIKEEAEQTNEKPTIFSGIDYQGGWYAPGGKSYVAELFRDAGGDYILGDNEETGSQMLDFETVYDKAYAADYWINIGYANDNDELLALDPRFAKFDAYKNGNVYHYNARVNENGGNDYWESGIIHPDIVLADLVKILHPDLLPDHEFYYYTHIGQE
ncbi:ABC transporter substrate-binding protein [Methanospirillum stamsii]|nr:ABC transporter substrate-binding protein [Methanospirillum stamsii]